MAIPLANAGGDQSFLFTDLPIVSVALTGSGVDPDLGAIVSYQWAILQAPAGSIAAFDDATLQNPNLLNVDLPGTYRLMLVVTDDQAESSESDPLVAPAAAFAHINVASEHLEVVAPAPGERSWYTKFYDLFDALEDLHEFAHDHDIVDHDTVATGADLDELVGGGDTTLHTHAGSSVSVATTAALGVVKLAESPVDPANPKAVTQDRIYLTAFVQGTFLAGGWSPGIIDKAAPPTNESEALCAWYLDEAVTLSHFSATWLDGGEDNTDWIIAFYDMTPAQFVANDFAGATLLATIVAKQGATDHTPLRDQTAIAGTAVTAAHLVVAKVTTGPSDGGKEPGAGLTLKVTCKKLV